MWPKHAKKADPSSAVGVSGLRWNFESMKKAIKTEIMNSFFAVCHVAVCCLKAWACGFHLERALLGCHWVKGSVMVSTSELALVAGSCLGWLAWGVTVFNWSHIWRRVAICQKTALILPSESWKTFTPLYKQFFLITIIKVVAQMLSILFVARWLAEKRAKREITNLWFWQVWVWARRAFY